jgi:hypothetical protein
MLANTPRSETTFAWAGNREVRLAAGTKCPYCGRGLHATDITVSGPEGAATLICAGCHRVVLVTEAPDPDNEGAAS